MVTLHSDFCSLFLWPPVVTLCLYSERIWRWEYWKNFLQRQKWGWNPRGLISVIRKRKKREEYNIAGYNAWWEDLSISLRGLTWLCMSSVHSWSTFTCKKDFVNKVGLKSVFCIYFFIEIFCSSVRSLDSLLSEFELHESWWIQIPLRKCHHSK